MTEPQISHFLDAARALRPPIVQSTRGFSNALEKWLRQELTRCHDMAFGERFMRGCPVDGATPQDYLNRILETDEVGRALTGIRFMGGDLERPFVDLIATEQTLRDGFDVAPLVASLLHTYRHFQPRAVRVLWPHPSPPSWTVSASIQVHIDQVLSIGIVRRADALESSARLATLAQSTQVAAAVDAIYRAHFEQDPGSTRWLSPADLTEIQRCIELGHVLILPGEQDEILGILAVEEANMLGIPGFWVIEEVVHPEARGAGLASRGQRTLSSLLANDKPEALLCGTIDARNLASRRTAAHARRHETMAYSWLYPTGTALDW